MNYVTGNVQNVVPGVNLPLVFSSETTICHLYDKVYINQHTCYNNMCPYYFREGIIQLYKYVIYSLWIDRVDPMADKMRMPISPSRAKVMLF